MNLLQKLRKWLSPSSDVNAEGESINFEHSDVGIFSEVILLGAFNVVIKKGDSWVVEHPQSNKYFTIQITNKDGILYVTQNGHGDFCARFDIVITAPVLESIVAKGAVYVKSDVNTSEEFFIEADGVSNVSVSGIDAKSLDIECSGASSVVATGRSVITEARVDGTSAVDLIKFATEHGEYHIMGASSTKIKAPSLSLKCNVSGVSYLFCNGDRPEVVKKSVSFASKIIFS